MRPAPPCDPPFDDDVSPQVWGGTATQLTLDWALRADERESVVAPPAPPDGATIAGASMEARQAVRRFVGRFIEVLNGFRPATQLRQLCATAQAAGIVAQAQAAAYRIAQARRESGGAHRSAARHGRGPDPVAVTRWRLCEPRPGAVEATVLLVTGHRTWALALRLERPAAGWVATVLRLL